MYRVFIILTLAVMLLFIGCESGQKVLLILRETKGSYDQQFMGTNEAVVMKSMLEEAGFKVVIASASGRTFLRGDITLESDLKLAEVKIADYVGFIIPCMSLGRGRTTRGARDPKPEEVAIAKQVVAKGKPVAAQRQGVAVLAQAGVLVGRKYSFSSGVSFDPRFAEAIYGGEGVVQDGNIITSAYCPFYDSLDQTAELTQAFIAELQE